MLLEIREQGFERGSGGRLVRRWLSTSPAKRRRLGDHDGQHLFTVGQRRGLGVAADQPLYVLAKDAERNRAVIAALAAALDAHPRDLVVVLTGSDAGVNGLLKAAPDLAALGLVGIAILHGDLNSRVLRS